MMLHSKGAATDGRSGFSRKPDHNRLDNLAGAAFTDERTGKPEKKEARKAVADRANSGKAGGGCSAFGGGAMGAHRKNVERIVVTTKS